MTAVSPLHAGPAQPLLGRAGHGVTRLAGLLRSPAAAPPPVLDLAGASPRAAAERILAEAGPGEHLHLHVSDALLGRDPVAVVRALAGARRLALTLHDVPQPEEGPGRFVRRRAIYAAAAGAADLVLVCSDHERRVLLAAGVTTPVAVTPHPIEPPARLVPAAGLVPGTVGVLGWLYPGKGHEAVLDAMATAMPGGTLLAMGAPSTGHEDLPVRLAARAQELGLGFTATGYLLDDDLMALAATVAVPVCAHRHVSASGTIGTWMTAGRAPLVHDGPFAREVSARCGPALERVQPRDLPAAIGRAAARPHATVLDAATAAGIGPGFGEAAALQAQLLAGWMGAR